MIYTLIKKDDDDVIKAIISFDSITSFDESWSATVTSQTVEYGFDVTDNINIEAPTYDISAIISSYSLFNMDSELVWDGTDFVSVGDTTRDSHIEARDEIIEMFKGRNILTLLESSANSVNTDLTQKYGELTASHNREIEDCVMTSLKISHPDNGTGAFVVSISLQKINRASILIEQLTVEEMRAALRPLAKTFETQNSKQKTEKGDTDPVSGLPLEEDAIDPTTGDRAAQRAVREDNSGFKSDEAQLKATERATKETYATGTTHTALKTGKGYDVVDGVNDAARLKVGGLVAVYEAEE